MSIYKKILILITLFLLSSMYLFSQEYHYDTLIYNNEGRLNGLHTLSGPKGAEYTHLYRDGVLLESVNYTVNVEGISPLKGIYKDNKPFEGYFVHLVGETELLITDYYENGIQVAQYSRPVNFSDEEVYLEEGPLPKTTFKSTYRNGKIWNGLQYYIYRLQDQAFLIATENYKDGERQHVDLLLGAVHFAEMFKLEFKSDGYILTSGGNYEEKGGKMVVKFTEAGKGSLSVTGGHKFKFYNAPVGQPIEKVWGQLHYYINEDAIWYQHANELEIDYKKFDHSRSTINMVFEIQRRRVALLHAEGSNNYAQLFHDKSEDRDEYYNLLFLIKGGEPFTGVLIEKGNAANTYSYTKFKKGEKGESKQNIPFEEFVEKVKLQQEDFNVGF